MSKLTVPCPICKSPVRWNEDSVFRPFCSERCRTMDLGEWASGNRAIPADSEHDDTTASDLGRNED